ncbi:LAQU0S09e00276g1_1 [Lachancea quebecensis]|uniref:General negative regulator of transcription subunit n=1 Tax=Lachancea quebecensis TaxID=1654605 RepID=A0A0P1KVJ0_9SACH|nr:LAQU0S09e00276g1_1 [Lachancea quebecensis]
MAHRKLQQEVDRVFKKISEGLEIFDTYYERHENCTNNPSQKDKLECDLKREVKKLQRLREQIKSWQSSPDIKDKDSLLEHRRSVEVAMEKYKAVEKASKEKAYSNNSLKRSDNLDPKERERQEITDYLSQSIEELERQYDSVQVEVDKLILLNKKKKTATTANEEKKNQLKGLQGRYRWHLQQMELALRLVANQELDPEDVKRVKDDINYYIESNQEPDFVEDETIYDGLDLTSNEAIAHEVAAAFAAQRSEELEEDMAKEGAKLSKKEQRKLEREAKKAAKSSAKTGSTSDPLPESSGIVIPQKSEARHNDSTSESPSVSASRSPSPDVSSAGTSIPNTANSKVTIQPLSSAGSVNLAGKLPGPQIKQQTISREATPELQGHTHIHQTLNGITTTSTLKPATVPARPVGDLRWAAAASQAAEKEKKADHLNHQATISQSSSSSVNNSATTSAASTPMVAKQALTPVGQKRVLSNSSMLTATVPSSVGIQAYNNTLPSQNATTPQDGKAGEPAIEEVIEESYDSEYSIDDFDESLDDEIVDTEESASKSQIREHLRETLSDDLELLVLPGGIQDFIMSSLISKNGLNKSNGSCGKLRTINDACRISRLDSIPESVNPPSPLDAFRSTSVWDVTRCSLRDEIEEFSGDRSMERAHLLEKFRGLETFFLFYCFYYSITPLEQEIAYTLLGERNWKVSKTGENWFSRHSLPKFSNELCEVADFKIFNLDDWTVADKLNFKLDYSILRDPPSKEAETGLDDDPNESGAWSKSTVVQ